MARKDPIVGLQFIYTIVLIAAVAEPSPGSGATLLINRIWYGHCDYCRGGPIFGAYALQGYTHIDTDGQGSHDFIYALMMLGKKQYYCLDFAPDQQNRILL